MKRIITFLDRLAHSAGAVVSPLTFLVMLFTCIVVAARYLFRIGAIPLQEAIVYLHGIIFMLGIAYTLKEGGHVRVDVLYHRFSRRTRATIDLLGSLFFLFPVGIFIFWTSLDYVSLSWSMKEGSAEPGGLPAVYLLKALIPMMAILLLLQGVAEFSRSLVTLMDRRG